MNNFKEWLSDYLRYFLLLLAAVLTFFLIVIGVKVYRAVTSPVMEDPASVLAETDQIVQTELITETVIDTEQDSESDVSPEHSADIGDDIETEGESQSVPAVEVQTIPDTEIQTEPQTDLQTEAQTEPQTEPQTEYVPVYKTLKGSCYIRSAPSMEADIIGEYMYGTTVEFLEDVGGWFKVRIDGMTGYMGARFF